MSNNGIKYSTIVKSIIMRKLTGKPVPDIGAIGLSMLQAPLMLLAVKYNLIDYINEGYNTYAKLAQKCNLTERDVQVLLSTLIALGLIDLKKNVLSLSIISKITLLHDAKYNCIEILDMFKNSTYDQVEKAIFHKKDVFTHGESTVTDMWENDAVDMDFIHKYNKNHHNLTLLNAELGIKTSDVKKVKKLLDVGGGLGTFSICFVDDYPERTAGLYELKNVCTVASSFYKEHGYENKIEVIEGNFFERELPAGYDGMVFSNILHDWNEEKGRMLLSKAFNALDKGGKIFLNEALLNETKTGPMGTVLLDVLMYINHKSQQYTFREITEMLTTAGFKNVRKHTFPTNFSLVVADKPL